MFGFLRKRRKPEPTMRAVKTRHGYVLEAKTSRGWRAVDAGGNYRTRAYVDAKIIADEDTPDESYLRLIHNNLSSCDEAARAWGANRYTSVERHYYGGILSKDDSCTN